MPLVFVRESCLDRDRVRDLERDRSEECRCRSLCRRFGSMPSFSVSRCTTDALPLLSLKDTGAKVPLVRDESSEDQRASKEETALDDDDADWGASGRRGAGAQYSILRRCSCCFCSSCCLRRRSSWRFLRFSRRSSLLCSCCSCLWRFGFARLGRCCCCCCCSCRSPKGCCLRSVSRLDWGLRRLFDSILSHTTVSLLWLLLPKEMELSEKKLSTSVMDEIAVDQAVDPA